MTITGNFFNSKFKQAVVLLFLMSRYSGLHVTAGRLVPFPDGLVLIQEYRRNPQAQRVEDIAGTLVSTPNHQETQLTYRRPPR